MMLKSGMATITGSIDNAGIWNSNYHLVFTEHELIQFVVMTGRERVSDIYHADMANPSRMVPVAGAVSNYSTTRNEIQAIVAENVRRGKEIEENLDEKMKGDPSSFTRIPYENIDSVEISNGSALALPHLIIKTGRRSVKFHLLHNNYQGRGRLDGETFSSYRNTLERVFGEKLNVKQ